MLSSDDIDIANIAAYWSNSKANEQEVIFSRVVEKLTREHLLKDISAYLAENLMSPKDYSEAILLKFGV